MGRKKVNGGHHYLREKDKKRIFIIFEGVWANNCSSIPDISITFQNSKKNFEKCKAFIIPLFAFRPMGYIIDINSTLTGIVRLKPCLMDSTSIFSCIQCGQFYFFLLVKSLS